MTVLEYKQKLGNLTVKELWEAGRLLRSDPLLNEQWHFLVTKQAITPAFYVYHQVRFSRYGVDIDILDCWQPEVCELALQLTDEIRKKARNCSNRWDETVFFEETYAALEEYDVNFAQENDVEVQTLVEEVF